MNVSSTSKFVAEMLGTMVLVLIGVSVNAARSNGSAVFAGGEALSPLWLFLITPVLGGVVAALVYGFLIDNPKSFKD